MKPTVRVQSQPIDVAADTASLATGRGDIGALVSFQGICRDEDGTLAALEIEHYPGMAESEIGKIAGEAVVRWSLSGLAVIHRHGRVTPGETIVLVVASARHRSAAFEAAAFVMDYLKSRAPFWKLEHRTDGVKAGWVDARETDELALARWSR